MGNTWLPRLLDIDLSSGKVSTLRYSEEQVRPYIGGSGLAASLLAESTGPDTDPLSESNVLIYSLGPLAGTIAPTSGRHHITAKSPQTGIFGESDVGGYFGRALRRAGFAGLVIRGKAPGPAYILVEDAARFDDSHAHEAVRVLDASSLWGKDAIAADEALKARHGSDVEVSVIGQAGERLARIAAIMHDGRSSRAAGRCGLGAVMGSKNLKAVVVRSTSNQVPLHDPEGFRESVRAENRHLPGGAARMGQYGTAGGVVHAEEIGDLPIKNWFQGEFKEGAQKLSGVVMAETILTKRFGCAACPIRCGREVELKSPQYGGYWGAGPEYESLGSLGSMLLVDDLEAVTYAAYLCNAYGLDTISTGGVIAFAIEAFERGYLDVADFDGHAPAWGSVDTLFRLVTMIGERRGIGEILGNGVRAAAAALGIPADADFVIHVKGLEPPMHDPRAYNSLAVGYATSNRGACHLQGFSHPVERGVPMPELGFPEQLDRFATADKGRLVAKMQDLMCVFDSAKLCKFLVVAGRPRPTTIADWLAKATGWDIDFDEMMLAGERISNLKRMYNVRCGISRKDDTLPKRIATHKRGSGGAAENLPDLEAMLDDYYAARGWTSDGIPEKHTLDRLGVK